jgi:hypothetical protein
MSDKSFGSRLLAILSSLRLAVVTMVVLASVCGYATFYEMRNGTPAVQRDIYQTPWFAFLLALLGLNVFSVMVSRWPWSKHQIGFLIAHVGILSILVGSVISLYRGLDSNMVLAEGETTDRVRLLEKALSVSIPGLGVHGTFPVVYEKSPPTADRAKRYPIPGSDVVLVADAWEPHVVVGESFEPANGRGFPALHFQLQAPMGAQDAWLVPDDPQRSHLDFGPVSFGFHAAATAADLPGLLAQHEGARHLSFVLGPDGTLHYAAASSAGATRTGTVTPGEPLDTGWAVAITVDRFLPAAALRRVVTPATPPAKEERRDPAVKMHLEGPAGRTEPEWVLFGEQRRVLFGDQVASLSYRQPELALPFRVTLLSFANTPYPGSRMASTFESRVRVDDPDEGTFETLISMNNPLHHRGYIFFQSSFIEGRPMVSIFSVARAPGLPIVYFGVTLIGVGIIWMFYVKPWLARRQAAQALAARRTRESLSDEAKSAGPVSAGA